MIIKSKADNEAVLSNVGQIGEFRIRNSAKAFGILSSGLYANKIRAIVREYSCNAVDSHVEAGRGDVPFDVHLPSNLEPWFSIRDYGIGLDEQQVTNIYTTYFESTKTNTDDLIGGLGLGSKSAFSYTDNFTIVAIKNGTKRVFTAFINDVGVPSIAKMGEELTEEPTGVEIRFAVEDNYDFRKFYSEAQAVYKHFKLRPVISGTTDFKFVDPDYSETNIIPGIHLSEDRYERNSVAIMGNIEYPIDVPSNADLGGLQNLLKCGLTIEFAIGELDIQASREGLSYVPETIASIKNKLEALNSVLLGKLSTEANKIKNIWERTQFLHTKSRIALWQAPVKTYVTNNKLDHISLSRYGSIEIAGVKINATDVTTKYNIAINAFTRSSWGNFSVISPRREYDYNNQVDLGHFYTFYMSTNDQFVVNNTKVGAVERAKYHIKNSKDDKLGKDVYVLSKADKTKEMDIKGFFKALKNPPKSQIRNADTLMLKPRTTSIGKNIAILKLEKRNNERRLNSDDQVWRDAGNIDKFDDTKTYYYLPLSGFTIQGAAQLYDSQTFFKAVKNSGLGPQQIYGVRKSDIASIKDKKNWINLDEYLVGQLSNIDVSLTKRIATSMSDFDKMFKLVPIDKVDANSVYSTVYFKYSGALAATYDSHNAIKLLLTVYQINNAFSDSLDKMVAEIKDIEKRYPLIMALDRKYYRGGDDVANYVNAMDLLYAQKSEKE